MDDYVDVAERIRQFKERYPEGSLQSLIKPKRWYFGEQIYVVYCAAAYRTPDDPRPGIGWAWEPVPGPTPFTRDSELMNAETSAWGRAIVALGFETKKIASANEVRNRNVEQQVVDEYVEEKRKEAFQAPASEKPVPKGVLDELATVLRLLDSSFPEHPGPGRKWADVAKGHTRDRFQKASSKDLTLAEARELITWLEDQYTQAAKEEAIPFS